MTPTAYVQAGTLDGYLSRSCYAVARDLARMGYRIRPFTPGNQPLTVSPDTPVKGCTACVKAIYERTFNRPYPNVDIPAPLKSFARRKVWQTTLGALRAQERAQPLSTRDVFVKPLIDPKAFKGGPFDHRATELMYHPDDYPILAQERIRFGPELRIFVGPRGVQAQPSLLDRQHRELIPHARAMYHAWKDRAPKAYVMDVAWTYHTLARQPALVEINSILTAGNLDDTRNPGELTLAAWKSYVHYAEHGRFR